MNVMLIETFLSVVYNQSITKAANELFLSQSTVSSRLQQLETELGVKLIERKKGIRNIELTARGRAFLPVAQRYQQLDHEIAFFQSNEFSHSLTIACPDSLNTFLFRPLYQQLINADSHFNLTIRTQHSPEIYSMVDRYEADIGFVFHQSRYSNMMTELAVKEKMVLLVSSKGNWPERPIHPSELDKRFELYMRWSEEIVLWHDYWWSFGVNPYTMLDTATLLAGFFDDSRCWALCPVSVAQGLVHNGYITVRTCAEPIPDRASYMLTRSNRIDTEEIRIFRKFFFQYVRSLNLSTWPVVAIAPGTDR